ncbi:myosin-2 essential light chain [Drosophila nasuta]|uniref:Myosin-2 essential light chain n=1 Tax=Drosophila albomicans TaxID=7291 RepID=A0A6P8XVF3_DROAB|nr:myosin-2 essential light chain [Drosophila albomicans]XP_060644732.1 myosin-2 essential light chain [Drosophila nasuta]
MANKLSGDRMRREFLQHSQRGDAKIAHSQLGDCLRVLGLNPSEASIRQHIRQLHEQHIERISFDEFMSIYNSIQSEDSDSPEAEHFIAGLRLLDEQHTGYIAASRLRYILANCGECLTEAELDELLEHHVNDQGLVDYAELVHALMAES